jgi:hypothetical protein
MIQELLWYAEVWCLFGNNMPNFTILFRSLSQRSSEMEYINKYRQLEAQEFDMYGSDQTTNGPGKQGIYKYLKYDM